MSAIAALLQKKKATIQESAPLPEITNEQALDDARKRARARRGLGSTLLAGDTDFNAMNVQKKRLLGG
jgi:hypothetical protein